jgi:hypothetical protein
MSDHLLALVTKQDVETLKSVIPTDATAALNIIKKCEETFEAYEPGAIEQAQSEYGRDGECEIDDGAVCSRGADNGLYVQAWVWIADDELDEDDEEEQENA